VTSTLEATPLDVDPRMAGIQIEAKLRDWNLTYEYVEEFPVAEIRSVDWTQVREAEHIADKDTLAEFRTQMTQGAVYPPIVVMHPNVLVDGNHRVAAAKGLRRKTFPAFVVQFNSVDLAKSFSAAMNQLNGRRLTSREAFSAATTMMARGMADEAIAREIGRSPSSVRDMRRQNEFTERAARIPEIAKLAESVPVKAQMKLAQISHDPAFAEAVKVVAETRAAARTVSEVVEAATSARTDADAIDAVRAKRAELAPAGPPPHRVTIPQEVKQAGMHLGGLLKLGVNQMALLDISSPERRTESLAKWGQLRDLAVSVIDLYGKQ
jgi:ParB-like chromosome segregation protein Spo0J